MHFLLLEHRYYMGKILKKRKNIIFLLLSFALVSCVHPEPINNACDPSTKKRDVEPSETMPKPFKPQDAINSIVLVVGSVYHNKQSIGDWYGSGAIVGHNEKHGTMILTAGHVCVISGFPTPPDGMGPLTWTLSIVDKDDKMYLAKVSFVVKEFDACLINIDLIDSPTLELATEVLSVGDIVTSISAPFAVFGDGVSLIYDGRFAGVFILDTGSDVALYTLPSAQGSSGAPILDDTGKIVGLISQVNGSFHHITISPTQKELKTLFSGKANTVKYTFPSLVN